VALASSSSDPEPAPRHRATEAQRRARLDELVEARRQLDEEMAILHRELGQDPDPRDRQAVQMVLVQEQPREGNCESAAQPSNNLGPATRCRWPKDVCLTMTDEPTRAQMSTPTPTLMPRRS
jgi:hypothetical protein